MKTEFKKEEQATEESSITIIGIIFYILCMIFLIPVAFITGEFIEPFSKEGAAGITFEIVFIVLCCLF